MEERAFWETIKAEGTEVLERVKQVVHEGNVRRVRIKQGIALSRISRSQSVWWEPCWLRCWRLSARLWPC